jgi:hypothetical protein
LLPTKLTSQIQQAPEIAPHRCCVAGEDTNRRQASAAPNRASVEPEEGCHPALTRRAGDVEPKPTYLVDDAAADGRTCVVLSIYILMKTCKKTQHIIVTVVLTWLGKWMYNSTTQFQVLGLKSGFLLLFKNKKQL